MLEFTLKQQGKIKRLTNQTFQLDQRYKDGFFSAAYFLKTEEIIKEVHPNNLVTVQFFQRKHSILCGIDEAIALIHTFAKNPQDLYIEALNDGDEISPLEPVLKITGRYQDFGFLEGPIDGILARRTSVASNCHRILQAAAGVPVIFFGDRDDDPKNQPGDGYAAYIGGIRSFCTDTMGQWIGYKGMGTMPHALIVMFKMNLLEAAKAFYEKYPQDNLIVLVDSNNDVITDSLKVADYFKEKLYGVRIDTSKALVDKYFERENITDPTIEKNGVNVTLIKALRKALDKNGYSQVKIVVSSGFDEEKCQKFAAEKAPVDFYGVGSSLLKVTTSFTGDCVKIDGVNMAKVGRHEMFSDRLKKVDYPIR